MRSFVTVFVLATMVVAGNAFAQPNLCDLHPNLPQCDGEDNGAGNVDVDVETFTVQDQDQHQRQDQDQANSQTVLFEDREAASSSASLYLGTCQAGMSAQTIQGGGAIGSPDEVCLLFTASQVAATQGRKVLAEKLLDEAVDILKVRSNPVRRFLQGIPLIGRVM